jgi:hypothetical protein
MKNNKMNLINNVSIINDKLLTNNDKCSNIINNLYNENNDNTILIIKNKIENNDKLAICEILYLKKILKNEDHKLFINFPN